MLYHDSYMNPFIIAYSDNPEADFILSFDDKFFLWVMTVLTLSLIHI